MTRTQHSKACQLPRRDSKTSWHQCFHTVSSERSRNVFIHGSMSSTVPISTFQITNVSTVKDATVPTIQASSVSTLHRCESLHPSRLQPFEASRLRTATFSRMNVSTSQTGNVSTVKDTSVSTSQASSVSTVHVCESFHASRQQSLKVPRLLRAAVVLRLDASTFQFANVSMAKRRNKSQLDWGKT